MKSKCSFILKTSLALVLALMMVVGSVAAVVAEVAQPMIAEAQSADTAKAIAGAADNPASDIDDLTLSGDNADTYASDEAAAVVREKGADIAGVGANVDLAKTGWDTSKTAIVTYNGSGWDWHKSAGGNQYFDFDIVNATNNLHYQIVVDDKWYGIYDQNNSWNSGVFNDSNDWNYTYNNHNNNQSYDVVANFPAGQYVMKLIHGVKSDNYASYNLYRKKAYYNGSVDSNSSAWQNLLMDYIGDGVYKYEFTGNGVQHRFRVKFVDGDTTTTHYPGSNADIGDLNDYEHAYYTTKTNDDYSGSNYFYFDAAKGCKYTVYLKNQYVWITRTPTIKVYGEPSGEDSWNNKDSAAAAVLTYSGTNGKYYYEVADASSVTHILYRFYDTGTQKYYKAGDSDVDFSGYDEDNKLSMTEVSSDPSSGAFRMQSITAGSLNSYKIWADFSGATAYTWIEPVLNETSYYLTGYLNGGTVDTTDNSRKFTETSSGSGIYTLTWAPTGDHEGHQYATIYTGSTAYHPATHPGLNGAAATMTDSAPGDDNKWKVGAVSGQTVTFTWDTTGASPTLSWTVSGSSASSNWLYSKDGTTEFTPPTASEGTYRFVWSTNDDGPGKAGTTAIAAKVGSNAYWADITSYVKSNSQFYFALSNNDNNGGIRGNKQEQINGDTKAPGTTGTIAGGGFIAEMKEKGSVTGNAYFQLIRNVDFTKVSAIGVLAKYSGSGKVNYEYYYKLVSSGDDQITSVTVYAKDGAAPINWNDKGSGGADAISGGTKYNYAAIATTNITQIDGATPAAGVVTTVDCGNASSQYRTASVDAGKAITVTTTILSTYRSKYYVVGWCINGVTYKCNGTPGVNAASDTPTGTGLCTLTYTIPAEPEVDYLEITPIYYIRESANSNVITFYLEGYNTVIEKWGNTPYIYPFYGNLENVKNSFGVYPGQPMVYADGKYSTQIPLKDYPISGSTTNTAIKGITINNGYADHVHRNMIYKWTEHDNDAEHKQTYDYDDFYKIYEECLKNGSEHPNSIIFRIIDETDTYNRSTYGGSNSGARVVETKSSLTTTDLNDINGGNGWEVLRNRYGQPIDLFGTVVSEPSGPTAVGDNVRVVSTGYNANIAGDYGTAWKVYKKNGSSYSLIKDETNDRYAAPPSIFLLRGNASGYSTTTITYPAADHSVTGVGSYTDSISKYEGIYKTAYGDSAVKGKPVYITFEKDAQDTRDNAAGTGAYRLDGRWYYTHASDNVTSTLGIEHWDNSTATWVKETVNDPSTGDGNTSGTKKNNVQFDSDSRLSASNLITSQSRLISGNTSLGFTATAGTGYLFDGWYIKYSDTSYDKIVGATETASIKATANYELIARFVPIVTGSLTIEHKLSASSTGEGTVDMQVIVKNGNSTLQTYNGSRVYIDGTYISNSFSSYTIDVTLKTTPKYDGKVTAFGYDKFNTNNSITATTNPGTLPGGENTLTTSHFTFTVGDLYVGTTLSTSSLTYTSIIEETPHYYNFVYNFTTRDNLSKSYTSKGEISLKDYKQFFGSNVAAQKQAFVKAKAPFESNFLKKNTLPGVTPSYNSEYHIYTATSTFSESADIPVYTVRFKLPYDYYDDKSGDHKKYTLDGSTYNASKATFDLAANYDEFVTVGATDMTPGPQTNVSKSTAVNHTDNDFITAPDQVGSMYFAYWSIKRLADNAETQASAPEVSRIYYPDFHYRIYGDYYVEAVFSSNEADSWHNKYSDTNDNGCSILYIGDSRNQWNNGNGITSTSTSADVAADIIYNDFIFNYRNNGAELKGSDKVKIGMIIERVVDNSNPSNKKWAEGSADVSDMSYYETKDYGTGYDAETVKEDILNKLGSADSLSADTTTKRSGCVYIDWDTANLNNKNYLEKYYNVYSAYGQTVGDSIEFTTDNAIDNYVYRAYAVMKYDSNNDGSPDKWCISDPAYFCMRYTANLKYSE